MQPADFDERFLATGVDAMCSIPVAEWNCAHWGAGVVAACFFVRDRPLSPATVQGIARAVEHMISSQRTWFSTTPPSERGDLAAVTQALQGEPWRLRALGHDLIFTTLVLRAFHLRPDLATTARIDGLLALRNRIDEEGPGGPFPGCPDPAAIRVEPHDDISSLDTAANLARASLDAFAAVGSVYPGLDQGVVHHVLTHAQALLWLDELGYQALSASRRESQRRYLKLLRYRPSGPGAIDSARATLSDARKPTFWDHDFARDPLPWLIGHIFKVPPAFHALADAANLSTSERRQREQFLNATLDIRT